MSHRISEIVEVIEQFLALARDPATDAPVWVLRSECDRRVAAWRGIHPTTVSDKYRRQLAPQLRGTGAIEPYLTALRLVAELRRALEAHAVDSVDRARLGRLFGEIGQLAADSSADVNESAA